MRVKALQNGWDGRMRRKAGDVFDYNGPLGKWMEPVDAEVTEKKQPRGEGEMALSEVQKEQALRQSIMKQLDAAGIGYFKGATTEKLQALLDNKE